MITFNKSNRRIYSFLKQPDFKIEPQGQVILNTIQIHSPLNRFELVNILAGKLETTRDVSQVLSFHQRLLERYESILVEEPEEFKQRIAEKKARIMNAMIVPSGMGGWSIQLPGEPRPIGSYPTREDAQHVIAVNNYDELYAEQMSPS